MAALRVQWTGDAVVSTQRATKKSANDRGIAASAPQVAPEYEAKSKDDCIIQIW